MWTINAHNSKKGKTKMNIGIIAALIMTTSYIPHVTSILKGHTRPHRGSRFIWTSLAFLSFYAQYTAGATDGLWFTGVMSLASFIVLILSISYGEYGFSFMDIHIYIFTLVAVIASIVLKNPLVSLVLIIFVDASAGYLTIKKVTQEPYSENILAYVLGALAAGLTLFGIGEMNITFLLYPAYIALFNILVTAIMIQHRQFAFALK